MNYDAVFFGGSIHTGENEAKTYSVMGVKGGRVAFVGDAFPERMTAKNLVDLAGRHVFPALIDAHLHLMFTIALSGRSFAACEIKDGGVYPNDIAGIAARLKENCAKYRKNDVVVINNYIISAIKESRLPTSAELDEWGAGRAVVVYSIDGHSSALSGAMLKKVGLPAGDGVFTGKAHEDMQGRVTDAIAASVGLKQLAKGVAEFQNICAGYGVTVVCALDGNADTDNDKLTKLCASLARRMDIGVRLYSQYQSTDRAAEFVNCQSRPRIGGCGEWETDGAVGSHSAAFYAPYADTGETHDSYMTLEQAKALVERADGLGYQIASHAIGSKAIDVMLKALSSLGSGTMHRIEHFEFPTREAVELVKRSNIAVCVQPGYSWVDKRYLKSYERFLPNEIIDAQIPLKELVESGVCVCGGSDSPVQAIDPYIQLLGMTDFYLPEQSLSPFMAFRAYTKSAADAILEGGERGTLSPGMAADFFVSEKNFFELSPAEIARFEVSDTYIAGKKYRQKRGGILELAAMFLRRPKKI